MSRSTFASFLAREADAELMPNFLCAPPSCLFESSETETAVINPPDVMMTDEGEIVLSGDSEGEVVVLPTPPRTITVNISASKESSASLAASEVCKN